MRKDRRALLEEYAKYLVHLGQTTSANEVYRDLLRYWPYALHNHRRFSQSLLEAAVSAHDSGNRGVEDSCLYESEQVIRKLLEIAPADRWAVDFLHRVQHKIYKQ